MGRTPIMREDISIVYRRWLADHGASITNMMPWVNQTPTSDDLDARTQAFSRVTVAHYLMYTLGSIRKAHPNRLYRDVTTSLVHKVCSIEAGDSCQCGRAGTEGCTPLSIFFRSFYRFFPPSTYSRGIPSDGNMTKLQKPTILPLSTIGNTLIRVATFESLRIRHTCCHQILGQYPIITENYGDDFPDIRAEDEQLLEELEELVAEFQEEFHLGKHSLPNFITGRLSKRMYYVIREKETRQLTEEEKRAAAELGVKLVEENNTETSHQQVNTSKA
ncbi:hypothetical protein F4811DRAFT_307473 [Daldinia bambusicola]|nr:hypothetical protein F4811DRAFT_307473 [Daldinia bambusicola]